MAHLIWLDTDLLTHEEEERRYKVYRDLQITCGWARGKILAQLPSWDFIRKTIASRGTGERESVREGLILERILNEGKSLFLAGLHGRDYEKLAQESPLIDFLLKEDLPTDHWCPKYQPLEEFILNPPEFSTDTTWTDPVFLKRLDILAIGSTHIDVVDQYLPLDGPNPFFEHFIKSFGVGGPFRKYLTCRPEIRMHFSERPADWGKAAVLSADETTGSLLKRMNASRLTEAFSVVFALWEKGKHHDRKIIGDIGGFHLGRGSTPTSQPFAATCLPDPKGDRITLELDMQNKRGFYRCLP